MDAFGILELKVVALAVDDRQRAEDFYGRTLGLQPAEEGSFVLGSQLIMLKATAEGWPARPSAELNPRLTLAVRDALQLETALKERGVTVSDPVALYEAGTFHVGAFLDSEGNKWWFCSPNAN